MSTLYIYGVDFGTSRSLIGFFKKRVIEIISDITQNKAIPSFAFLKNKDEWVFGSLAKKLAPSNPERFIYDTKRMLGHNYDDPEIVERRDIWQFKTYGEEKTNKIKISIDIDGETVEYYPYQISGLILKNLVDMANKRSTIKTNKIVVTIPATFTKFQTDELEKAAEYAGLQIVRFINEPIAASIAYEFMSYEEEEIKKNKKILIFDLGAGTLDISLIEMQNGCYKHLAEDGDKFLGGRDWDDCLSKYVIKEMKNKYPNKEFTNNIIEKIYQKSEEAKIALSSSNSCDIIIESNNESEDLKISLTREKFYEITNHLFERCILPIEKVLKSQNFDRNDIDSIILVGGSTYIPKIHDILLKYINDDIDSYQGVDPEEAVVYGACIVGSKTSLEEIITNEPLDQDFNQYDDTNEIMINKIQNIGVCCISIGIKYINNAYDLLIPNKCQIPYKCCKNFYTIYLFTQNGDIPIYANVETKNSEMIDVIKLPYENIGNISPLSQIQIKVEISLDKIITIEIVTHEDKIKKHFGLDQLEQNSKDASEYSISYSNNYYNQNADSTYNNSQYPNYKNNYNQNYQNYSQPHSNYNYSGNYSYYSSNNSYQANINYEVYSNTNQNQPQNHSYMVYNYQQPYYSSRNNNSQIYSQKKSTTQQNHSYSKYNNVDPNISNSRRCTKKELKSTSNNNNNNNDYFSNFNNSSYACQSNKFDNFLEDDIWSNKSQNKKSNEKNLPMIEDNFNKKNKELYKKEKKAKNMYIEQQNQNEAFEENEFQEKKDKKKRKCLIC